MHKKINYFLFVFTLSLLASCAVQVPPSGGQKDLIAPKVEKMVPENKTLNFQAREINIKFNEFILLNNPTDQIVISPPLDEKPEYEVRGKVLKILFLKPLKSNTTYTINFGNAVTDNHEGNQIENLRYVFSTGTDIDSNQITGTILNSFNRKAEKNISIGLYDADGFSDSIIYKTKPLYFGKSKDNGYFSLENIPDKPFYLIAFNDENKNIKYDKNEPLVFIKSPIVATDTTYTNTTLWLFNPDLYSINRLLDTFSRESGKFCFLVYKPTQIRFTPIKNISFEQWVVKGKNDIDSIFIYSNQLLQDSIVRFKMEYSGGLQELAVKPRKKSKLPAFDIDIPTKIELSDSISLKSTTPLEYIDTSRIIFKEDTVKISPQFILSITKNNYTILHNLKEKTRYSIELKDSALRDLFGQYNKKKRVDLSMKSLKDYSSLKLNFILPITNDLYIIQLISDNESIVYKEFSIYASSEKLFDNLLPGSYKIKIIRDINKNGRWDNGDFSSKRQPEQVYYYNETINLKAYWDMEQTIDLNKIIF